MPKGNRQKRLMGPEPDAPDAVRRQLLTGGALTVAASAAAVGTSVAAEPGSDDGARSATDAGYQVTDHIAAYYARARG